jgi:6-phosphogluconolactonase
VGGWLAGAYGPDMDGTARGITRLTSRDNGSLAVEPGWLIEADSPAFLAPSGADLVAALEGRGAIALVRAGERSLAAQITTGGAWPCHIGSYGETLVVANYFDGTLGVIDSELESVAVVEPPPGSGPHPSQGGPHAHATVRMAPGVVLSADLGADRIHVHRLADGVLTRTASIAVRAGFGPRDFLRAPGGQNTPLLYVLGEHGRSVIVSRWTGTTLEILSETALPGALEGDQASALGMHAGRLYAGLRGSNRVAVLRTEGETLEPLTSVSSEGAWPRHLVVDGPVMHVANQQSNSVASFSIDADGVPRPIAEPTFVASPTYLLAD